MYEFDVREIFNLFIILIQLINFIKSGTQKSSQKVSIKRLFFALKAKWLLNL